MSGHPLYSQVPDSPTILQTPPLNQSATMADTPGQGPPSPGLTASHTTPFIPSPLNPSTSNPPSIREEASSSDGSSTHRRSMVLDGGAGYPMPPSANQGNSPYAALQSPTLAQGQDDVPFTPPAFTTHPSRDSLASAPESARALRQSIAGGDFSRYSFLGRPPNTPGTPGTPGTMNGRETPNGYFSSSSDDIYGNLRHSASDAGLLNAAPMGQSNYRHSVASSLYSEGGQGFSHSRYSTFIPQPLPKRDDSDLLWDPKNAETDDYLHDPEPGKREKTVYSSSRGWMNVSVIIILVAGLLAIFMAWPVIIRSTKNPWVVRGATNVGWTNSSGQVPAIPGFPDLRDSHTPAEALKWTSFETGEQWDLVFSDEFEVPGRTFWPGDDPYWEAVSLNYWQTVNLEWLDPDAITTENGKMVITLTQEAISNYIGNFSYRSGMVQSWNKVCFRDAYIEVSVSLPGTPNQVGYWPGAWTMGNLARAGFGASNDGLWPYSYDACDVGTLRNQTMPDGTPTAARTAGDPDYGGSLSYLPGQRLSACSCPNSGDSHPGPNPGVGRGGPEIDILEAQADYRGYGTASQSMQIAPFDDHWNWQNTTPHLEIYDAARTTLNQWKGSINQEAASAVTRLDATSYNGNGYFNIGYEFKGGNDGYITWAVNQTKSWTLRGSAFPANPTTQISNRPISQEPMYAILNLFISNKFQGDLDFTRLSFPQKFYIDYVRVYKKLEGDDPALDCSPDDMPTEKFINDHMVAYREPSFTTWRRAGYEWPKNRLTDTC